jgi:heme exporter protein A
VLPAMISSLTAENLACARGDRTLFKGLSFRLERGQALAVEGANGAGKTSLLRLIAGFLAPKAGHLLVVTDQGESDDGEERGKHIGWLGHQDGLKPQLTVCEQLSFFSALYGCASDPDRALDEVGLTRQKHFPCRFLSAGQKRRLGLARLMLSDRPLWLLDEPLAALDSEGESLVRRLMTRHCEAGGLLIAATHAPLGFAMPAVRL